MINYLKLIKPNIVFGNLLSFFCGMSISCTTKIDMKILICLFISIFLIISSSCIINNIIDRNFDKIMNRTKTRFILIKKISIFYLYIVSLIFCFLGFLIFYFLVNFYSFIVILLGYFLYTIPYSMYSKKKKLLFNLFLGCISGSSPIIGGYLALNKNINFFIVFFLFVILFSWQIPHFISIFLYYLNEYKVAKIQTLNELYKFSFINSLYLIFFFIFFVFSILFLFYINVSYILIFIFFFINILWIIVSLNNFFCKKLKINISIISIFSFFIFIISNNFL
ncbi:MAG: UbiA family prenyltransferase [Enterobacteriaceae bacterium]